MEACSGAAASSFLAWPILGALIGLFVAQKRGTPVLYAVLGGVLLGPFAFMLLWMSVVSRNEAQKKCPHCDEWVKAAATVCKHCHRDLSPVTAAKPEKRAAVIIEDGQDSHTRTETSAATASKRAFTGTEQQHETARTNSRTLAIPGGGFSVPFLAAAIGFLLGLATYAAIASRNTCLVTSDASPTVISAQHYDDVATTLVRQKATPDQELRAALQCIRDRATALREVGSDGTEVDINESMHKMAELSGDDGYRLGRTGEALAWCFRVTEPIESSCGGL